MTLTKSNSKHVTAMSVKMHATVKKSDDGNLLGELDCIYFEEPFAFSSLMNMIEIMEATFDAKGFPEKHMLPRTFGKAKERIRKHETDLQAILTNEVHIKERSVSKDNSGSDTMECSPPEDNTENEASGCSLVKEKICRFEILVRFRHNAEWQGNIKWLEKDVTKDFSSILELTKLMDNALAE